MANLPSPHFNCRFMENNYQQKRQKSFNNMRTVMDATRAILILGVGVILFFGAKMGIGAINDIDPLIKNMFGGLCLLYGGFRLYRSFKREY